MKNETGDTSDESNYRPVAQVTASSRLFEMILLDLIEKNMNTCDNQFGLKQRCSTDLCIYTLKDVTEHHRKRNNAGAREV